MIQNRKIIVVIPSGRKANMEILLAYLFRDKGLIDEIHLWVNTAISSDLDYIFDISEKNSDFIKIVPPPMKQQLRGDSPYVVGCFYKFCNDPDAIYIKCDDDICFIENGTIEELVLFRIQNPKPFLVYPNIINNVIMSHLHQRLGCLPIEDGIFTYQDHCPNGLKSGELATKIHQNFIYHYTENNLNCYKFTQWTFWEFMRVSINFIVFFGEDIKNYSREDEDEAILSTMIPYTLNRPCVIYGNKIVSHFSYMPQRPMPNEDLLLESYKKIMLKETGGLI